MILCDLRTDMGGKESHKFIIVSFVSKYFKNF